jgi:hypothetical protein
MEPTSSSGSGPSQRLGRAWARPRAPSPDTDGRRRRPVAGRAARRPRLRGRIRRPGLLQRNSTTRNRYSRTHAPVAVEPDVGQEPHLLVAPPPKGARRSRCRLRGGPRHRRPSDEERLRACVSRVHAHARPRSPDPAVLFTTDRARAIRERSGASGRATLDASRTTVKTQLTLRRRSASLLERISADSG